jgi:ABC-type cobalamin/Fe3+-siderophores transport system ATPase subunit
MGKKMINKLEIDIQNIQHIKNLNYKIDLSNNRLHCIVGKNSVGKTTLIKIIQNLKESDTLDKFSRLNIINQDSKITYTINDTSYIFDPKIINKKYILDTNKIIPRDSRNSIFTEFPIPYGQRFDTYARLGNIGKDIASKFAINDYDEQPMELIDLLNAIYNTSTYNDLEQLNIKNIKYYIKPLNTQNYIREDDFSSGEYMIIQLYKLITQQNKFIVIDELDISLDSSAQVNLIEQLQKLCKKYNSNILFTTHSLAIMKKIDQIEEHLYYMKNYDGLVSIEKRSYNFIKAELFQFVGYDKIILVEDILAKEFIEYNLLNQNIFCKYKVIFIGGHSETVGIFHRNKIDNFFGTDKVLVILDGDQQYNTYDPIYDSTVGVNFLPILSVEKELHSYFMQNQLDTIIDRINYPDNIGHKALYKRIVRSKKDMTDNQIFNLIKENKENQIKDFVKSIIDFLNE